jgi:tetratricopeptide (TPR) repeat protein
VKRRTILLFALLVVTGSIAAWLRYGARTEQQSVRTPVSLPASSPAVAPAHPRVDDRAGILAPFGPRLGRMADDFARDLGVDVHVVTLKETGAIESQSERVFRERGIGDGAPTGGLLILLNSHTQQARIEVGYSLEAGLTDLHAGRIARDQLAPYVSYTAAGMAVMDVLHYLRDQVYLSAAVGNIQLGQEFRRQPAFADIERYLSGGAGAKTHLSATPMDADLKRVVPASRRARYAPSAEAKESVAAFLRVMSDLAGDPTLTLFTEGSRLMRAQYPFARFEELKRLESIDASQPLEYRVKGDYAVATSLRPASGFVPILLRREDGLWRIDLVETWKNLFFDADGNYFLRNSNTPYSFGLREFGEGEWHGIGEVPLGGRSIAEVLAELDARDDLLSTLWRAEIRFRNAFLSLAALADYEKAIRAVPQDPLAHELLATRAMYLGFPELAIPAFQVAGPGFEIKLAEAWHEAGDPEESNRWVDRALEADPYSLRPLRWKAFLAERYGTAEEGEVARSRVAAVTTNPEWPTNPVLLRFEPPEPRLNVDSGVESDSVTVYDHSRFGVTMTNTSRRPVVIDSVRLTSRGGSGAASGLGDIKDYWRYPSGGYTLEPRESIYFDKLWGFTVDTAHEYVRYVFRTCWHGVGESVRQCRVQSVDVFP